MFSIIPDPRGYREYVLLKDGQGVLLRLATPDDRPRLEALVGRVSRESLRLRFMGGVSQVPARFLGELCSGDLRDAGCLLAIIGDGDDARVVGFGNYVAAGTRNIAEVAFLVEDAWQGRGISTLILERLAGIAAGMGFVAFEADVLFENQAMIQVFRSSGFDVRQAVDGGAYHLEFPVAGATAVRERAELRERIATAASVARLLRPKVVAVVGASRRRTSIGSLIFQHVLKNNFTGTVYPVNTQATSVHGVKAYPSLADLPEPPDLVVVAVPAAKVAGVADDALHAGAKGLIVVTSGFAETGHEGVERQRRLLDTVRSQGGRLVGPNCLGLLNTDPDVRLDASLAPELPPEGRIGFFSHSAALGLVILQYAAERGLGFSTFVSAGNRADVSGNDLLQYWEEDPATDIAMLYLEAFGNPRRFARVARRVSAKKPVLCVKSARSRAGRSAAAAHIGAAPLSDVEVEVLFQQAGVIRVDTLEELFDVAVLLAHQPLPLGNRVAILGNSGGVVTITADACEGRGLEVVGAATRDLGPLAGPEDYRRAVQAALEDEDVDAAIVIFLCVGECQPELVGRGIRRGVVGAEHRTATPKPVLLCLMGATGLVQFSVRGPGGTTTVFPSYRFPEGAARALGHAAGYAAYRRRPPGRVEWLDDVEPAAARRVLEQTIPAGRTEPVPLNRDESAAVLRHFGIAVAASDAGRGRQARTLLTVRSHPDFGPVVALRRGRKRATDRITPLTDRDIAGMLDEVGISDAGESRLLARVSQLVEELPWMIELSASVVRSDEDDRAALGADLRTAFVRPE